MKKLALYIAIALAGACAASKAVVNNPTPRIEFMAEDLYPEGVAYDSATNVYYLSSVRTGTISKVTPAGEYAVLFADADLKSTYGVKLHPDGRRLYACVSDANYSKYTSPATQKKMARLVIIDVQNGRKTADIDLSKLVEGKHFVNDLAFDKMGNAYITDSYAHAIYKVDAGGRATVFAKSKQFETEGVGLNGIVYHPAGYLLASNSAKGSIYKIDLATQQVTKVKMDTYLLGADGLLLQDAGNLIVVVNGGSNKIFQLATTDNWQTAQPAAATLAADMFAYPSTATRNGSDTWVVNAKFNELQDSNNVPSKMFALQKAVFRPLP